MTKFEESLMKEVQQYWEKNKGKPQGVTKTGGVHRKVTVEKKFGLNDLAEKYNMTTGQARRILYVKGKEKKD